MEKLARTPAGIRKAAVWLAIFGLILLTSSIALSRLLERSAPDLAVVLYPLNSDAIAQRSADRLMKGLDQPGLLNLQREVEDAIHHDRLDARLFGLLGETTNRLGQDGRGYFDHAFRLSKTELLTLHHMVVRSIQDGQPVEAVGYLDILLRRWPERFDQVLPILPALLADPAGYKAMFDHLSQAPPWRSSAIDALSLQPETLPFAGKLLLDLVDSKNPPSPSEVSASITRYIRNRRYDDAYRLFLFTLTDEQRARNGYVFNEDFGHLPLKRPFDWQLQEQSGLEIALPSDRGGGKNGAVVRFLDKPVKSISLQQYLHLPPGDYRLSLEASAKNLSLPKNLFWALICIDPNNLLEKVDIPEGTYSQTRLEKDFRIEAKDCPLQRLRLETGLIAESWRYRYSGTLTMHKVNIERLLP